MEPTQIISNCKHYSTNIKCQECELGFILDYSQLECLEIENTSICKGFSKLGCSECDKGYFLNKNKFINDFKDIINDPSEDKDLTILKQTDSNLEKLTISPPVCERILVDHCVVISERDKCERCEDGYFLKERKCHLNPSPVINNCSVYKSIN